MLVIQVGPSNHEPAGGQKSSWLQPCGLRDFHVLHGQQYGGERAGEVLRCEAGTAPAAGFGGDDPEQLLEAERCLAGATRELTSTNYLCERETFSRGAQEGSGCADARL